MSLLVLVWYQAHSLPVTPITPSRSTIIVQNTTYNTIESPSALPHPAQTALSIVTQPSITKEILKEAKEAGVSAVWLQPGSFDDEGLEYAKREFKIGVGGTEGGTRGREGWCVLVDGDNTLVAATEGAGGKL